LGGCVCVPVCLSVITVDMEVLLQSRLAGGIMFSTGRYVASLNSST